jgi:hypothetical protein
MAETVQPDFLPYVSSPQDLLEVARHLRQQFAEIYDCYCGVVCPGIGSKIEVTIPLQTCHESSGDGLENQCIPKGIYTVKHFDGGSSSHTIVLAKDNGETVFAFYGYSDPICVDWRGCKKAQ